MSPTPPRAAPPFATPLPVHVLGATGSVGQRFVRLLADHPWFTLAGVSASERSAGRPYGEAVDWILPEPLPEEARALPVSGPDDPPAARLVFSALDAGAAQRLERPLARAGHVVVTNASAHRLDADVPLVVPEVNPEHLALLARQDFPGGGALLANPNCTTIGLSLALAPLQARYGVRKLLVTTLQAASGAGLTGPSLYRLSDNVLPHIAGEEEKVSFELPIIFGHLEEQGVVPTPILVGATCMRVPVVDGHTMSVSVKFWHPSDPTEWIEAWRDFRGLPQELGLPSAPSSPVVVLAEPDAPQPRLHRDLERGMASVIGRVRPCRILDASFVVLSHNTLRGAAGGALLLAELALATGAVRGEGA